MFCLYIGAVAVQITRGSVVARNTHVRPNARGQEEDKKRKGRGKEKRKGKGERERGNRE